MLISRAVFTLRFCVTCARIKNSNGPYQINENLLLIGIIYGLLGTQRIFV